MKITKILVLFLSMVIVITACNKDEDKDDDKTPDPVFTESFTAKVDGVSFTSTQTTAMLMMGKVTITAIDGNNKITLQILSTAGAGTYTLGGILDDYVGIYDIINPSTGHVAISGTLVVTEHNTSKKQIKGTFNFIASEMNGNPDVNITDGSLAVQY